MRQFFGGLAGVVLGLAIWAALGYVSLWNCIMLSLVDLIKEIKGNVEPIILAGDAFYIVLGCFVFYYTCIFCITMIAEGFKYVYLTFHKPSPTEQLANAIVSGMFKNYR